MDLEEINPELRTQVLEYAKKIKEFNLNLLKKHEEMYKRCLVIFDPKSKKKLFTRVNQTRNIEKNWENNAVKNRHQTRDDSKNPIDESSLDAPAPVTVVSDMSTRSTRRAAQIADMKNKNCLAFSLNQKLRQPSLLSELPASKRNLGAEVSPVPPAKYRRTKNRQSAGNSYVKNKEYTNDVVTAEADSTIRSDILEADKIEEMPEKIREEHCSNSAGRTFVQINNVNLMAPNYILEDRECFQQLTTVALVHIEQQTNKMGAISDSGISEEDHQSNNEYCGKNGLIKNYKTNEVDGLESEVQIVKASRTKVLKSSEVENLDVEIISCVNEAPINIHNKKKETFNSLENKNSDLNRGEKNCEPSSVECVENLNAFEENNIVHQESNGITKPQTRTKVIKTSALNTNDVDAVHENNKKQNEEERSTVRTRTKILKTKDNNLFSDTSDDSEKETNKVRTRTKVLRKGNTSDYVEKENSSVQTKVLKTKGIFPEPSNEVFVTDTETSKVRTRTKILKARNDENTDKNVKQVAVFKSYEFPESELVKKRVEEFERVLDKNIPVENGNGRMTRTKTKALKAAVPTDRTEPPVMEEKLNHDIFEECEKENLQRDESSNHLAEGKSEKGGTRCTPLAPHNRIGTPVVSNSKKGLFTYKHKIKPSVVALERVFIHSTPVGVEEKRKEEELFIKQKKTEAATKKKEKTLKAAAEETRRRREEKLKKVAAARQAAEKEKAALALKLEKEKEEKEKQIQLEREKQKEEISRKKLITQQKIQEAEERRKMDEAARLAKIQEQEAEHKRIMANRQKEQEAAERLHQLRQMEELRVKEAEKLKKNQKLHKLASANAKLNDKANKSEGVTTYDITPHRDERPITKPKTENDYGLMDCHTDDSSDDEQRPKKTVPQWALAKNRNKDLHDQKYLTHLLSSFMTCNPKPVLKEIFSEKELPSRRFHRTSSAIWTTPPVYQIQ